MGEYDIVIDWDHLESGLIDKTRPTLPKLLKSKLIQTTKHYNSKLRR